MYLGGTEENYRNWVPGTNSNLGYPKYERELSITIADFGRIHSCIFFSIAYTCTIYAVVASPANIA
jgi:hypothetical protein